MPEYTSEFFTTGSTVPLMQKLMPNKEEQVFEIFNLLKFKKAEVLEIAYDILHSLKEDSKDDINISYTGENELLIYRNINGEYRNLIIDDDGDVVYLHIPNDRRNTYNEFFPYMMVDAQALAKKL